jgi:hypothetical protein
LACGADLANAHELGILIVDCVDDQLQCTDYRGPLLIVSTKLPRIAPVGFVLAVVQLKDCRPM